MHIDPAQLAILAGAAASSAAGGWRAARRVAAKGGVSVMAEAMRSFVALRSTRRGRSAEVRRHDLEVMVELRRRPGNQAADPSGIQDDLVAEVAGRPGWTMAGDVATYTPDGAEWTARVWQTWHAQRAGPRWHAALIDSTGIACHVRPCFMPTEAVEWAERSAGRRTRGR
jgi:hypothetical protein